MLCPTCHIMFNTHFKPKVFTALLEMGRKDLPESWRKSIYQQAAEAIGKSFGKEGSDQRGDRTAQALKVISL
jgi:hypothetical protein